LGFYQDSGKSSTFLRMWAIPSKAEFTCRKSWLPRMLSRCFSFAGYVDPNAPTTVQSKYSMLELRDWTSPSSTTSEVTRPLNTALLELRH
jgi:hypothetical protein